MENENKSLIEQAVERMNEMSAKAHYKKYQNKFKVPPIDKSRYPNKEQQGLEGPYRSKKSGKIFYYDKKAGKYYDTDSDMYLSVDDVMEHFDPENPEYDPEMSEMNIGEAKEPAHFAKKRDDGTYSVLKNHPRGAMGMSHGHDKATADRLVAKHNKSAEVRSRRDAGIPDVAGKYKGQTLFAGKKNEEIDGQGKYVEKKRDKQHLAKYKRKAPEGAPHGGYVSKGGGKVAFNAPQRSKSSKFTGMGKRAKLPYQTMPKKVGEEVEQVDEKETTYLDKKRNKRNPARDMRKAPDGSPTDGYYAKGDGSHAPRKPSKYTAQGRRRYEDVEQVDEKKKKVSSFRDMINRVAGDAVKAGEKRRKERGKDSSGHVPGKIRFGKREESVEQIDELDAKTLIRYNNAASQQVTRDTKTDTGKVTPKTVKRLKGALKARKKLDKIMPGLRQETISDEDAKRMGIDQPLKGKGFPYNEDVEQIDEKEDHVYHVSNIDYDADKRSKRRLPKKMKVRVPHDVHKDGQDAVDDHISDHISDTTGWLHKGYNSRRVKEEVELDELKMPAKDAEGRIKDPTIRKAYKQGQRIADLKADKKLRNKDAEGAEGHLKRSQERRAKSRNEEVDLDEAPKIKVKLNPEKKIGYKIQSVGPGGKKITTKMKDWPGKKDIGENISDLEKANPEPTAKEMDKALNDKEYDKKLDAIRAKKNK